MIEHLSEIPLFKGLPRVPLESLASISLKKTFNKDKVIFFEGSESIGFYIVISGKVKIYKNSLQKARNRSFIFLARENHSERCRPLQEILFLLMQRQ